MLQASKLSCSCHEATVSFPPALGDEVVVPVLGAQATSMTVPAVATTSRCNQRGRAPVIRALVALMVGAFYGRPPKRVNESPAFLRFAKKYSPEGVDFPGKVLLPAAAHHGAELA